MSLRASEIQAQARQLYESFGPRALAQAVQRANACTRDGRADDARTWRRIEEALFLIRGPRET